VPDHDAVHPHWTQPPTPMHGGLKFHIISPPDSLEGSNGSGPVIGVIKVRMRGI